MNAVQSAASSTASSAKPRTGLGRSAARWAAGATLALGLLLTVLAAGWQQRSNARELQQQTQTRGARLVESLATQVRSYERGLNGLRAATAAMGGLQRMTPDAFEAYQRTRGMHRDYPGIYGFGLVRRVLPAEVPAFVQAQRRAGRPDFKLQTIDQSADVQYIVQYQANIDGTRLTLGRDLASEPQRRATADRALRSGGPQLSPPLVLALPPATPRRLFLLMLPLDTAANADGSAQAVGWAFAALVADDWFAAVDRVSNEFTLRLQDIDPQTGSAATFFEQPGMPAEGQPCPGDTRLSQNLFGREWRISICARPEFVAEMQRPSTQTVAGAGAALSVLVAGLAGLAVRTREGRRDLLRLRTRLAEYVNEAADPIVVTDEHDRILRWNPAAGRVFGYTAQQALGRQLADLLVPPELHAEHLAIYQQGNKAQDLVRSETQRRHCDGHAVDVALRVTPLPNPEGAWREWVHAMHDIAERKALQRQEAEFRATLEQQVAQRTAELQTALRENRALLATVHEHSMVAIYDRKGVILEINEAFCRVTGYTREELIGQPQLMLRAEAGEPAHWQEMFTVLRSGRIWHGQICNRAKDGSLFWTDTTAAPLHDARGRIERYLSLRHDVTGLRRVQAQLELSEQRQRLFANSVAEGILLAEEGKIVDVSDVWAAMFRCKPQDAVGRDTVDFVAPLLQADARRRIAEGHAEYYESVLVRADGSSFPALLRGHGVKLAGGRNVRLTTVMDMTRQRETEQRLAQARADADAANAAKSRFLANMSHEIRTPLNAVIGLSHLLTDTPLDAAQRELVNKVQIAGRSLLAQVNDVLDLSKIEAGEMALDLVNTELPALLQELLYLVDAEAQAKGLGLHLELAPELPAWVLVDELRLRQILLNLLGNALKFTERGQVLLRAGVVPGGDTGMVRLRLEVQDTGVGIAPDMLDQLFEPFVQADGTDRRRFGGTGLGLSIVRQLARMMGGEAGVSSTPGVGSIFWVELQVQPSEGSGRGPTHQALRVLVAEDDATQRQELAALARLLGWQVEAVADGRALVRAAMAHAGADADADGDAAMSTLAPDLPDVLIVDWQMPELDGLSALAELHRLLHGEHLPAAVVVSASQAAQVLSAEHAALADTILTKPISASALFNAVNTAVSRRAGSGELLLRSTRIDRVDSRWLDAVHVLVVDDNETNLMVASHILRRQGATLRTAADGREALNLLAQERFDAVLMDVQMPVLDGIAATLELRRNPAYSSLPVIALTAGALAAERQRALDAGMNDFLAKPFEPQQLVRLLRRHIEHARGSLLPVRPADAPAARRKTGQAVPASDASTGDPDWPQIEGLAAVEVRDRLNGDLGLFRQLLRRLLIDYRDLAACADDAQALLPDRNQLAARMHKLRGAAGALSATAVFELAGLVETAALGGVEDTALRAAVQALCTALAQLDEHAQAWLQHGDPEPAAADAQTPGAAKPLLDAAARAELIALLKVQDLSVLDRLAHNDAALRATLGAARHAKLIESLETLDFDGAVRLLAEPDADTVDRV